MKWLYRGEARAGGGPRLKAEWQAAEAIKIEPLSLAARALLIQTGDSGHSHPHSYVVRHTHLLSCGTWTDMRWHGCRHVHVHLHLKELFPLSVWVRLVSVPRLRNPSTPAWAGRQINRQVETSTQTNKPLCHSGVQASRSDTSVFGQFFCTHSSLCLLDLVFFFFFFLTEKGCKRSGFKCTVSVTSSMFWVFSCKGVKHSLFIIACACPC